MSLVASHWTAAQAMCIAHEPAHMLSVRAWEPMLFPQKGLAQQYDEFFISQLTNRLL